MHFKIDEFYSELGFIQKINPSIKLFFIFFIPAVCALIPHENAGSSFLMLILSFVLFKFSKIPLRIFLKRIPVVIPFIIYPVFLLIHAYLYGCNLFMSEDSQLYGKFIYFFGHKIEFTASEVSFSINLLLKSIATVNTVIVFTAATQFKMLMEAFGTFRLPGYFIMVFSSVWRYFEALINETLIMRTASSFKFFRPRNIFSAKTFSMIFSSIFLRSLRRAEMNNVSMELRGYKKNSVIRKKDVLHFSTDDFSFIFITIVFIIFACFFI